MQRAALGLEFMVQQIPILLAEDNREDAFLMRRAFELAVIPNPLLVVDNGRDAVNYLAGKGIYAERGKYPLPGLLLLDLKMPWMDGFDVLCWLRRKREFEALPVVILTSSKFQAGIDQSAQIGIYDYRIKPQDIEELVSLVADIRKRWLERQFGPCRGLLGMPESQDITPAPEDGFSAL